MIITTTNLFSQSCIVNVVFLKGQYTGECKNGKANGKGVAIGVDTFSGNFKNGYPEGYGKYTYRNRNYYEGEWKKGIYDGKGLLHLYKFDGTDSLELKGYFKMGKYGGVYKEPYSIDISSNKINEISIAKIGKKGETVTIIVKSITGGGSTLLGGTPSQNDSGKVISGYVIAKPQLTNLTVLSGTYLTKYVDDNNRFYNIYTLNAVQFPIRLALSFDSENAIVEIFERGDWKIEVKLDK